MLFDEDFDGLPAQLQCILEFLCFAVLQPIDQTRVERVGQCANINGGQICKVIQSLGKRLKSHIHRLAPLRTAAPKRSASWRVVTKSTWKGTKDSSSTSPIRARVDGSMSASIQKSKSEFQRASLPAREPKI